MGRPGEPEPDGDLNGALDDVSPPTPHDCSARVLVAVALVVVVGAWFVARGSDGGAVVRGADAVEDLAAPVTSTRQAAGTYARQVPSPVERSGTAAVTVGELMPPASTLPPAPPPTTVPPAPPTTSPPVVARPMPPEQPSPPPSATAAPPWAATTGPTPGGYLGTDVGCATGTSSAALDDLFANRMGPVIGHDYQHVYDLGGDRHLWLFQDTFLDHGGTATRLDQAAFAHNTAMLQEGSCFTLLHRGSSAAPTSFEPGTGEQQLSRWFWPLGGEAADGRLHVFWAEMTKTADPQVPDGLGWVPVRTWLGTYRISDLARIDFRPAPSSGVTPIYGYAVASDDTHSYLFGNTFDQNLARQGGYWSCPCSATAMWLARVPRGQLAAAPEYWTGTGWRGQASDGRPIVQRFHAENPMQPRFVGGRWVAVTKVDGYWGDELTVDVAPAPWGPWTTVSRRPLAPRGGDPLMNTYHAHLVPWLDGGSLVVSVSQNARDMARHAFPHPERYRLQFLSAEVPDAPPPPPTAAPAVTPPPSTAPPPPLPESTTTTSSSTSTTSTSTTSTTTSTSTTTTTTLPPSTSTTSSTLSSTSTSTSLSSTTTSSTTSPTVSPSSSGIWPDVPPNP